MADSKSEQKFDAAVKVIRSLPKSGSFQPSHEMMLNFYGNYKQAMEGPCKAAKPSFWDVVNKAKWEAWSKLGSISKKDAMENYVNALKKVIEEMPETEQASQFVESLEPFYKAVYCNEKNPPPIFNIFHSNESNGHTHKMNGHIEMNGNGAYGSHSPPNGLILNTSEASVVHNIEHVDNMVRNGDNYLGVVDRFNNDEVHDEITHDHRDDGSESAVEIGESGFTEVNGDDRHGGEKVNDNGDDNGDDDGGDDDDDDLFCDSFGPELLEQQVDKAELLNAEYILGTSEENVTNDVHHTNNYSSLSDVEVLEQFATRNEVDGSFQEESEVTHVHFGELESLSSAGDQSTLKNHGHLLNTIQGRSDMVTPNQLGVGGGGGDDKELLRATSGRKQAQRNVTQQTDKHARYGHHHRGRSQESDSDDSPHRSDPNSSSEREDVVIDRIADLLLEIQDNMKKILERLKRVEDSLQRNENFWYEKYIPSKTVVFLILWPFVVNIIFRYLRRRNATSSR